MANEDERTLSDLLREHTHGATVSGGRLVPDGDRLVYVPPENQDRCSEALA